MSSASSKTGAAPDEFRRMVFRRVPLVVMATAAAAGAIGGADWSERLGPLPWLVSLVVVGLPHGAADFAVSRRACRGWPLASVWCLYLAAMLLVAAAFTVAPLAVIVVFLGFSCWHFGAAHVDADGRGDGCTPRPISILSRGCAALAAPLVVWPSATAAVAADLGLLSSLSGVVSDRPWMATFLPPEAIVVAGYGLAAVAVTAAGIEGLRAAGRPDEMASWRRLIGDLVVITSLGVFTDPLFAVGTYFLVWHAWRQMAELDDTLSASPARSCPELARNLFHIHAAALPLLLPTWMAVGAVWWLWAPGLALRGLAIVSIAAYLVVTPAHELLGEFLRTKLAMSTRSPRLFWFGEVSRGRRPVRPEPRGTCPSGGTSRNGLRRARPAAWG